ncbi:unnamed protein product [Cuscuta campestris]|uniref:Uncharacterized protein n=1 Tax=Cuscuta campestris TaxID=132261 RepID=A0A484NNF6_9ASTE|nr:unnamed protein product [Cuscuta campestris]
MAVMEELAVVVGASGDGGTGGEGGVGSGGGASDCGGAEGVAFFQPVAMERLLSDSFFCQKPRMGRQTIRQSSYSLTEQIG